MPASDDALLRRGLRITRVSLTNAPKEFTFGGTGAALYAGMTILASVVLGWVTDEVIVPAFEAGEYEWGSLWLAAGAIVGVAVFKAVGVVGRRLGAYAAQYGLQADFRRRVTRKYLHLPIEWHRRHSTGELLSNANADIESAFFIAAPLPMSFAASLMLIITAVLLIVTDPVLAAIGFTVGPAIGFVNWYFSRRMRHAATLAQQARADVSEIAHESFDAAIVVKTMGREGAETTRFGAESEDLRDKMIEFARLRARFDPLMEALPNVAILLVLLGGAWRVQGGHLSAGEVVQFAYLFRLVALPMRVFGWLLGEMPRAIVGHERVENVLAATGGMAYGTASGAGEGGAATALENVGYQHPATRREDLVGRGNGEPSQDDSSTRGVEAVEFAVAPGKTVAVVGPTGSGKSTISSLMVRLFDPDTGIISFDGRDLRELDREELAEHVVVVFQEPFIFDDTVRGNITLGRDYSDDEVREAARLAAADEFVSALPDGYDTVVGERGSSLSGGQRQRVALARALIKKPRLLVLDDATSSVDPAVEAAILANLRDAAMPSTVIIVAYRRGSIALADEVVFVQEGTIAARGTHQELLETVPSYENLVTAYEQTEPEPAEVDR
ncbi:MAG: ABC transporter ATP-binding protein [Nitriliruptorales bacterium]|nr:ABC transporter ATP-binding protein [Nitriliruptorales bacterium]